MHRTQAFARALVIFMVAVGTTGVADEDSPKSALAELQGEWQIVDVHVGYGSAPDANLKKEWTIAFEKDLLIWKKNGKPSNYVWEIRLDPKRSPKWIDGVRIEGGIGGLKRETHQGLYKMDGDRLTLNQGGKGRERPEELEQGNWLVLERLKAKQ